MNTTEEALIVYSYFESFAVPCAAVAACCGRAEVLFTDAPSEIHSPQTAPCEWDLTHTAAMAELHSRVSLRHNEARRQTMGSQPLLHQHTHTMEDNIADGTYTVDDDTQGFFAKGREFESVGDAHT
jgi:hypothetical protein